MALLHCMLHNYLTRNGFWLRITWDHIPKSQTGMVLSVVLPDCTCDGSYKKETFPTVNVASL